MTPVKFIYKGIRRVWYIVCYHPFCHLVTKIKMRAFDVSYGSFWTNGIPIIESFGGGKITIGNGFRMNNGTVSNHIGFSSPCMFVVVGDAHLHIHDCVGISQTALCAVDADITIGRYTLMGGGVRIYSSDFHSLNYMDRRSGDTDSKNKKSAPVVIGEDCFIGAGTVILKGVTIGDRTIIGAGSVVTKSIPADCVAAGNPCRVLQDWR